MRKLWLVFLFLAICFSCTAWAKEKNTDAKEEGCRPAATITVEEMERRWPEQDSSEDLLYVKIKDEQVELYEGLAKNRSLRKQLILQLPNAEMLRLYTANKATYEQMSKMLLDYEADNTNFNGYKIITDKDLPRKLDNGVQIYRFWFMKIEREKASRRSSWNVPIGIGIGIGGRHHRHHRHGPWIGVGW